MKLLNKFKIILIVLTFILFILGTKVFATTDVNQQITKQSEKNVKIEKNTSIRIIPNISSDVLYISNVDTQVNILEQIDGWTYILVNNISGWVRTDKIIEQNVNTKNNEVTSEDNKKEKENTSEKLAYIKYDTVNLRKEASVDSKILAKLKLNDQVIILQEIDNIWIKVKVDNIEGYISKELISDQKQENQEEKNNSETSRSGDSASRQETTNVNEETTSKKDNNTKSNETEKDKSSTNKIATVSNKTKGEEVVEYAKKYLGYKYVYGGASPETGFDCSGFTSYVYKHFGYNLSRASTAQASQGTKVMKKDLKPGDLVIYKNRSLTRVGHVGIYIGNNKMIHASEPGVGVTITDIDSKSHKYPERFVMGRRIIN